MSRTTPPRPLDVAALFPQLAPLARAATRLHPYPGSPSAYDSSVGGPLLWPADEPWPHCAGPHVWDQVNAALSPQDVREQRRIRAAVAGRPDGLPEMARYTPEERAIDDRIRAGRPWPDGPVPLLPVAQLYTRDIPRLRPPGTAQADLLQVLWCPFDHPAHPRTALFWRSAAAITDPLAAPPEPPVVQFPGYLPRPCLLAPEDTVDYPDLLELDEDVQQRLGEWSAWEAAGPAVDGAYAVAPQEFYMDQLSHAPGWKVGGWSRWGLTDPVPRTCDACGTEMEPLLTIASAEWDPSTESWMTFEDRARSTGSHTGPEPWNPAMLDLARGYDLQLHACPAAADHPHIELVQ